MTPLLRPLSSCGLACAAALELPRTLRKSAFCGPASGFRWQPAPGRPMQYLSILAGLGHRPGRRNTLAFRVGFVESPTAWE